MNCSLSGFVSSGVGDASEAGVVDLDASGAGVDSLEAGRVDLEGISPENLDMAR